MQDYVIPPTEKALAIANAMYQGDVFEKSKEEHLAELVRARNCAIVAVDLLIETASEEKSVTWELVEVTTKSEKDYFMMTKAEIKKLLEDDSKENCVHEWEYSGQDPGSGRSEYECKHCCVSK